MKEAMKIIEQFEGIEAKKYWINTLKVSDSIKGRLLIHFNLI